MNRGREGIPADVTGIHRKILQKLWSTEWISSKELLETTNQAEYARRIRELRNEWGYPIEVRIKDGVHHYRLVKREASYPKRRRPYFTSKQKTEIIATTAARCNICGMKPPEGGIKGWLMWDHRKPFDRGGVTSSSNGQLLCVYCNNLKRQACGQCTKLDCRDCLFCHPEIAASTCVVGFPMETWAILEKLAKKENLTVSSLVSRVVEKSVKG